jgi:flavin reductase (DIM6/NTAB) family NADH-FMN oxidoreductase RutF
MELKKENFYRILAPRPTVLITTVDVQGRVNAAPFSFITPISSQPPLVGFASAPQRHTLKNIKATREFVINIPPADIIDEVWVCSKKFPEGVNELKQANLQEAPAKTVAPPIIKECVGWLECKFIYEKELGDHVLVVGEVLYAWVKDEALSEGEFDLSQAKPLMHITKRKFAVPTETLEPKVK